MFISGKSDYLAKRCLPPSTLQKFTSCLKQNVFMGLQDITRISSGITLRRDVGGGGLLPMFLKNCLRNPSFLPPPPLVCQNSHKIQLIKRRFLFSTQRHTGLVFAWSICCSDHSLCDEGHSFYQAITVMNGP